MANDNRRWGARKKVLVGGLIAYDQGTRCLSCSIRDTSDGGARIAASNPSHLPDEIYLINLRDRSGHAAKVSWRSGSEIGLAFLQSFPLVKFPDPSLNYLARLWMERMR